MTDIPKPTDRDLADCDAGAASALLSWQDAQAIGLGLAHPVSGMDHVPLATATGRVTADATRSPVPLPPFDNSAMDGFALRTADLIGPPPWSLPVAGRVAAGEAGMPLPPGTCLRILTGAAVPEGADCIVMQEHVTRLDDTILLETRPAPGLNIRRQAEDLPKGGVVLPKGRVIGPREAAVLAASGWARIPVHRRVRVALFCSGSELRDPGDPLAPGQIWNSNRYLLAAALASPWIDLHDMGAVPDNPAELAATLVAAAQNADMVISTGGMADGDEDHMPRLLRDAGGQVDALRVAIKPGKPVGLGRLGDALYVGLPGNPVAAFVTWTCLGAPILRALAGFAEPGLTFDRVRLSDGLDRRPGRSEFRPAQLLGPGADGLDRVRLMAASFSARIALLAQADGLALIPAEATTLPEGALIDFLPF